MSYVNRVECEIIPTSTFKIIRGCAGCGAKQTFSCRNNFRVNANGNHLDVWLIYSCEQCGHTYNLPIYERMNKSKIKENEYLKFLANDSDEVFKWGTNKVIFENHKAMIDWSENDYEVKSRFEESIILGEQTIQLNIVNQYNIPVRNDKIVATVLGITRTQAKSFMADEKIVVIKN